MTETEFEKRELIEEIIRRTLDDLADWNPPRLLPGIGPQYPEIFQEFAERKSSYCAKVRELLARKTVEQLRSEFLKDFGSAFNPLLQLKGIYFDYAKELDRLRKSLPPWFAGGWSVDRFRLDAAYWVDASSITISEAALMFVGLDPRKVQYEALFDGYSLDNRTDEVLYFLEDRFELLVRRFGDPDEDKVSISLAELCHWIAQENITVSYELSEIVKRKGSNADSSGRKSGATDFDKPLHARTRLMFQRVLVIAAIDAYGLRARKDSARVAKLMVSAGDFLGFHLDTKKLARQIRAGFAQLDDEVVAEIEKKEPKI